MNPKKQGGKRAGAGRPRGAETCIVSIRISVSMRDALAEVAKAENTTAGKWIENLISTKLSNP